MEPPPGGDFVQHKCKGHNRDGSPCKAYARVAMLCSPAPGRRRAMNGTVRLGLITILAGSVLAGCPGGGDKGARSNSGGPINVAIVANPQAQDLARLTPSLFTAQSNINVNYTILAEGTLREVITSSARAGGRQFDVVMIGPYEAPQFGKDGYTTDLTPKAS